MVRFRSHYKAIATCAALFYRFSLIHWNHVMYLAHLETAYQSSQLVCQNHFLSTFLHFTFIDFGSIFSQGKSLMPQYLDLKWAIKKPYSRLRHATTSRAIKYQNWVARFSPRVVSSEAFKNILRFIIVTVWWSLECEGPIMVFEKKHNEVSRNSQYHETVCQEL